MQRGKRNLHRGRKIWRDWPYPRCVSSPSTAISCPYCHHVRGVEDPTPMWREKRCIVCCRRSKPKRKTAWRMRWRATTGARWLCRRRWMYRNREIGGRRWNRRNETNDGRQRRLRCLEWSRPAFISRWLGRRISSWLAQKCSTAVKSDRTARSRSRSADLSLKGSCRWKVYTTRKSTRPRQRPRQSGCCWRRQRPRRESCAISTRRRHF